MHEYIVNIHMHTTYSDGGGSHRDIVQAALRAGVDAVIVTDHNVLVNGPEDIYEENGRRVLLLVGEEIHDPNRIPQKNHLLVFGAGREISHLAHDPQLLINAARETGGLTFIAHPIDPPMQAFGQAEKSDFSWVDWEIHGFTGIELWNAMSEFKALLRNKLAAIFYAFNFPAIAHAPFEATLQKWDALLNRGQRVVAIGGSDAHAINGRMGPLKRVLFPYEQHFRAINTHIQTPEPMTGEVEHDKHLVLDALREGRAFVGYDLPAPTRGFNFKAQGMNGATPMGGQISAKNGVTLQIRLPQRAECRLLRNGEPVKTWNNHETPTYTTTEAGVYRVEVYRPFRGKRRGWIFSNPIWVRA